MSRAKKQKVGGQAGQGHRHHPGPGVGHRGLHRPVEQPGGVGGDGGQPGPQHGGRQQEQGGAGGGRHLGQGQALLLPRLPTQEPLPHLHRAQQPGQQGPVDPGREQAPLGGREGHGRPPVEPPVTCHSILMLGVCLVTANNTCSLFIS